jgi:hypothetical protein
MASCDHTASAFSFHDVRLGFQQTKAPPVWLAAITQHPTFGIQLSVQYQLSVDKSAASMASRDHPTSSVNGRLARGGKLKEREKRTVLTWWFERRVLLRTAMRFNLDADGNVV